MLKRDVVDPVSGRALSLSKLGLGCSQVGSLGHPLHPHQWRRLIGEALDLGVTVFDTADIYGQGDSERIIGQALRQRRARAFVITKIGKRFSPAMRLIRPLKPLLKPLLPLRRAREAIRTRRDGVMETDFSPAYLTRALDASLYRLGVHHVDAVLLHGPPADIYRDPSVMNALNGFRHQGKALAIGASCETMSDLVAALEAPGLSLLQLSLDLIDAAWRTEFGATIAARGLIVLAREAIRAQPDLSAPQAIAAAATRPHIDCIIAGTSQADHLAELIDACDPDSHQDADGRSSTRPTPTFGD